MKWLQQLFCRHSHFQWTTTPINDHAKKTTGGCVDCGKRLPPRCEGCGR